MSTSTSNSPPSDPYAPEPGWESLENLTTSHAGRSFVRRDGSEDRYVVRYFRRTTDSALVGRVGFGIGCQGPPGHAHGGSMAAVLDDAMGVAAWVAGHMVLAAEIKIRFRNMLPLGTVAHLEASVSEVDGKRVKTRSKLVGSDGTVYSEGEGLFIQLAPERFRQMLEKATGGFG